MFRLLPSPVFPHSLTNQIAVSWGAEARQPRNRHRGTASPLATPIGATRSGTQSLHFTVCFNPLSTWLNTNSPTGTFVGYHFLNIYSCIHLGFVLKAFLTRCSSVSSICWFLLGEVTASRLGSFVITLRQE